MSFRRRNLVLSGASPAPPDAPGMAAAAAPPLPTSSRPSPSASPSPSPSPWPTPPWPVASRRTLTPARRAQLEPVQRRLRAALDDARRERQQQRLASTPTPTKTPPPLPPGARPSPLDGRPVTSTGTASLDALLGGYGGLALGHALLVEEQGTTDYAGLLLRAYAAEGLVQGHHVHVLGVGPAWRAELPGLADAAAVVPAAAAAASAGKMKIAWRYEALATPRPTAHAATSSSAAPFCHRFDLARRLAPADMAGSLHAVPLPNPLRLPPPDGTHADSPPSPSSLAHSPLRAFLAGVRAALDATPPATLHRVVLPQFLAPTLYALDGWRLSAVAALLLALRALLRQHPRRLSVAVALSTSLYPRFPPLGAGSSSSACAVTALLEHLCDSVVELVPLAPAAPGRPSASSSSSSSFSSSPSPAEAPDKMQGWFRVHKLQIYSDLGGNGASPQGHALRENLCFSVSASRGLVIAPYSLPPVDDEHSDHGHDKPAAAASNNLEF